MAQWEYKVILHKLLTRVPNEIVSSDVELSELLNSYGCSGLGTRRGHEPELSPGNRPYSSVWLLDCQLLPQETNRVHRPVNRIVDVVWMVRRGSSLLQRLRRPTTSVDATLLIWWGAGFLTRLVTAKAGIQRLRKPAPPVFAFHHDGLILCHTCEFGLSFYVLHDFSSHPR